MTRAAIRLGPVAVDPVEYAIQGNAVLGIRDSGKSYTASYMAERLMDAKIPFVAFDPIGVWRWLRVAGKGAGYPVVVAGGQPRSAADAAGRPRDRARRDARGRVAGHRPLFDEALKADWRRIVEAAVRTLLYENKQHGLRHVFIEEAAEFVPQNLRSTGSDGNIGAVYAEVEKLVRMGRNVGLGCTLINPRAEGVNKEVLELCDMLFLHRQRGRRSLENLGKWLDMADAPGQQGDPCQPVDPAAGRLLGVAGRI
jgi:DNA helicase HerA-like ATPase